MSHRVRRSQDGLTMPEILITVVLMSMLISALATTFATSFNSSRPNSQRVRQSNDAQLIASFLVRDAQAAGGTNPTTVSAYKSLSNFPNIPPYIPVPGVFVAPLSGQIGSYCTAAGTAVAQFDWNDRASSTTSHGHIVIYSIASNELIRTSCVDGPSSSTVKLAHEIGSAIATCDDPSCKPGLATSVTLDVTSTTPINGSPYHYRLTASLRPDNNQVPTGSPAPFLALGGVGCTNGTTGFSVDGHPNVTIYGQANVNATDNSDNDGDNNGDGNGNNDNGNGNGNGNNGNECPAMFLNGSSYTYSSGAISVLQGGTCDGCTKYSNYTTSFADPFASTLQPLAACGSGGSNPAPVGGKFQPGSQPLVFPKALNVGNIYFGAGTYVFCKGITVADNSTITTPPPNLPGVTFYIVSGGLSVDNATMTINGLVYAPTSVIDVGGGSFSATTVVAGALTAQGNSTAVVIGTPPAANISITGPATLPNWTVGRAYPTQTFTASGGGGTYTWSAKQLPTGLSISSAGVITGTPSAAETFATQVTVTDSLGDVTTQPFTIVINAPPAITGPPSLTDWTINRDYPGTAIIAVNGTTPHAWSATGLPPGLTISADKGVVSGTPSAISTPQTFTPVIKVTDAAGASDTQGYTIKINSPPSITGPVSLPDWTVGQNYPNETMSASNGTLPYTWAASGLPTGLGINAGTGVISGTPNAAGTFAVSVTVTDKAGASVTKNYSVTINPAPGIATASLPNAEVGVAYNFTLTPTSGGTPPFTWQLRNNPPSWLSINRNTGTLTGTPPANAAGAVNVAVRFTDSAGARSPTKNYSLTIAAAVQISGPGSLPNWTIQRDYPGTAMIGTGGVTPFRWSAAQLPAGLAINSSTGVISGTPSATGTSSITVTVVDAVGGSATRTYNNVTINAPPEVSTTSPLPAGERTVAYNKTIVGTKGTPAYSWAASGLPAGLSINAATGVLSGTPTVFGTFSVTITVRDVAGASGSTIFSLTLNDVPSGSGSLPNWTVGKPYPDPTLSGSGGTAPYTFTSTALPAGLSLNGSTGVVSGIPTTAATTAVTVTVHDSLGATSTLNFSIKISAAATITTASPLPAGTIGAAYPAVTIAKNGGGTAPFTWGATGLPAGLTIDPATGTISGTPTVAGVFSGVSVSLTDTAGAVATHPYSITISSSGTVSSTSPSALGQGATGQVVAINGSNFINGAPLAVSFSGSGISVGSVAFVSATTVNATLTISSSAPTGLRDVTLTNGDGSVSTGTGIFTVNPAPTVSLISPSSLAVGSSNVDVTITGTNFVSGALLSVSFSGAGITVNSTSFVNGAIVVNISIATSAATAACDVQLTNGDGGTTTVPGGFTVTP